MRILQGKLKHKEFLSKKGNDTTRPTTSIVKEAIFNKIAEHVQGSSFLDLFAGTGAMAFEAISRGAQRAVLIEKDPIGIRIIIENINQLEISNQCRAYKNEVLRAIAILARKGEQFDIIFLDPPYEATYALETITALSETNLLSSHGIIICEHHRREALPEQIGKLVQWGEKEYGNKRVTYYYQGVYHGEENEL